LVSILHLAAYAESREVVACLFGGLDKIDLEALRPILRQNYGKAEK